MMRRHPRRRPPASAPTALPDLVERLVPGLIEGEHPTLATLRRQYARASVREIKRSGRAFHAKFEVPEDAPAVSPLDFAGGYAGIRLAGVTLRAGCVLYVRGGFLSTLEGYTYEDDWPDHTVVESVTDVMPIEPNTAMHEHRTLGRAVEVAWRQYPRQEGSVWGSRVLMEAVRRCEPRCLVVNLGDRCFCGMPLIGSLVTGAHAVTQQAAGGVTRVIAVGEVGEMIRRWLELTGVAPPLHLAVCPDLESALGGLPAADESVS